MVNGIPNKRKAGNFMKLAAVLMLTLAWLSVVAFADGVEASLDRESVIAGEGALLTLRITGASPARPELPTVENLSVQARSQSHQTQMFNGSITTSMTYDYIVGSHTPGDYVIPAIEVTVKGQKFTTQPLKLKVLDAGAAQPPAGINPANPNAQAAQPPQEDAGQDRFGFLTVELADSERQHVYVGEIAPVRIKAWLPPDSRAQLTSGVQPEGKAFTLHNVSERPQQTQEMRDGKRYTVVTWFGGISATKAGDYPVSLSLDANVAVRDTSAPRPRRRRGGAFDDPFFNNIFDQFNAPMIQKDVMLKSEDQEIEVRALPVEGRPDSFTGAVGEFKLDGYDIPPAWNTGEPQEIMAQVSGSGNFSLLNAPKLKPADDWKTYRGKDEFTPGDQASFSGNKTFRFSAVPRKGGDQEAILEFSYFDPESATYKTVTGPPKVIQVAGEDLAEEEKPVAATEPVKKEKKSGLIGQHLDGSPSATLVPLVSRPVFAIMLGLSGVLVLLGGLISWIRKHRGNPQRLAREAMERATREAMDAAGRCAEARDVAGFFAASRLALQHQLGALWSQPAQAITSAEVWSRLPEDSPVSRFFREADSHEYNRSEGGEVLPEWRALLDQALASLTLTAR